MALLYIFKYAIIISYITHIKDIINIFIREEHILLIDREIYYIWLKSEELIWELPIRVWL